MSWINRLHLSFSKKGLEHDLDDELRFHIEMREKEFVAAGMTAHEARHKALRQFGNPALIKEAAREMDTIVLGFAMLLSAITAAVFGLAPGIAAFGAVG